jgi:hypothetical protein
MLVKRTTVPAYCWSLASPVSERLRYVASCFVHEGLRLIVTAGFAGTILKYSTNAVLRSFLRIRQTNKRGHAHTSYRSTSNVSSSGSGAHM